MSANTRLLAAQEALLKRLEREEAEDVKATTKLIERALEERKGSPQGVQVYGKFKVSWEEDGKPQKVEHKGDLTPAEFRRAVMNLPRVVGDKLAADARSRGPQLPPRYQILAAFRRRQEARKTKIYHAQEAIASLQGARKR